MVPRYNWCQTLSTSLQKNLKVSLFFLDKILCFEFFLIFFFENFKNSENDIILFLALGVSHISVKPSLWALLGVKTMKISALHFFFPQGYLAGTWSHVKIYMKKGSRFKKLYTHLCRHCIFLEKPHFAALDKITHYKATSKYTMNLS